MTRSMLVPQTIARWAVTTPDAPAVVDGPRTVSYRQLLQAAWRVAAAVRRAGAGRDDVVGLSCRRGIEGLSGMLGILLAGAAYLYLDPAWPVQRRRHMVRECRVPLALTDAPDDLDVPRLRLAEANRGLNITYPPKAEPGDLCYVVYTSGSTGTPKGVAVEHRGAANMAHRLAEAFDARPGARMLQFASWAWDAAAGEIFVTLAAGGTLVLAREAVRNGGEELAALLRAERVRIATLTPSLLAALPEGGLPDLRTVVAVGEPCPPELVARWAPGRVFLNGYGPSEATVAVTVGVCRPGMPVTIGRPLPGVTVRIVDASGAPVPDGQPGELIVGGEGVARGYVTAGREFTSGDRFLDGPGGRWYRTGDLVARQPDGSLAYRGRLDDQVKVNGHRIELAEVEQGLRRHPGVRACAVVAGTGRLVAYVVPGLPLSPPDLLAVAARWLPEFMLPSEIRLVDVLPLTGNGKLNRHALTADATPPAGERDVLGETLALVRQALDAGEVGPDDDVFDAGGHSLVAAQLAVAATERFGVPVTALHVYDHPTPAKLAGLVAELMAVERAA